MVDRVRFFSSKIHNYNVHIQRFICTFVRFLELGSQSIANSAGPFQNITRTNSEKNLTNPQHIKAEKINKISRLRLPNQNKASRQSCKKKGIPIQGTSIGDPDRPIRC
jgi:hypothetical protein